MKLLLHRLVDRWFYAGGESAGDRDAFGAGFSTETADLVFVGASQNGRVGADKAFFDIGNGVRIGEFERYVLHLGAGGDAPATGERLFDGGGFDVIDFSKATGTRGVAAYLGDDAPTGARALSVHDTFGAQETAFAIEGVIGSDADAMFAGNDGRDTIEGGAGADHLHGQRGADRLTGDVIKLLGPDADDLDAGDFIRG